MCETILRGLSENRDIWLWEPNSEWLSTEELGLKPSPSRGLLLYFGHRWVGYSTTLKTQSSRDNAPWKLLAKRALLWSDSYGVLYRKACTGKNFKQQVPPETKILGFWIVPWGTREQDSAMSRKLEDRTTREQVRATKLGKWTGWSKNLRPSRTESVNSRLKLLPHSPHFNLLHDVESRTFRLGRSGITKSIA